MMTRAWALFFGVLGRLTPGERGRELQALGRELAELVSSAPPPEFSRA
jgi:hypothetical protein